MTELLVKWFVRDAEHTEDAAVRMRYGILSGAAGIVCNLLLFAVKLAAGVLTRSISVTADAFNNLSDAASSVIGIVGARMAGKPADAEHPFGHGRIEYVSALIVAFLVIQVAFSLLKGSVQKIFAPEELLFSPGTLVILLLSVLVKLWLSAFNRKLGRQIDSGVMRATAADALGDAAATAATAASLAVYGLCGVNVDGLVGLAVSVLILLAGFGIAKDTLAPLIGEPADPETCRRITRLVESREGVVGSHDLIVHSYGPGHSMATVHAEVPNDLDVEEAHRIADEAEKEILRQLGIFAVIHVDPVDVKDSRMHVLRLLARGIAKKIDPRLTVHDFRLRHGENRDDLCFEVTVPRDYTEEMTERLKKELSRGIRELEPRCYCVITAERSYQQE